MKNKAFTQWTILCQNVTVFLPKILASFFSNAAKNENAPEFKLDSVKRSSFGDDKNATFIL